MRKILYNMFIIMLLFTFSMSLVSCEAITAQNINIDSASGMNGGSGMKGNPGGHGVPNGGPGKNGNQGMPGVPRMNDNTSDK